MFLFSVYLNIMDVKDNCKVIAIILRYGLFTSYLFLTFLNNQFSVYILKKICS